MMTVSETPSHLDCLANTGLSYTVRIFVDSQEFIRNTEYSPSDQFLTTDFFLCLGIVDIINNGDMISIDLNSIPTDLVIYQRKACAIKNIIDFSYQFDDSSGSYLKKNVGQVRGSTNLFMTLLMAES